MVTGTLDTGDLPKTQRYLTTATFKDFWDWGFGNRA